MIKSKEMIPPIILTAGNYSVTLYGVEHAEIKEIKRDGSGVTIVISCEWVNPERSEGKGKNSDKENEQVMITLNDLRDVDTLRKELAEAESDLEKIDSGFSFYNSFVNRVLKLKELASEGLRIKD